MTYLIYQNLVLVTATVNICDGMCTTVYTCDQTVVYMYTCHQGQTLCSKPVSLRFCATTTHTVSLTVAKGCCTIGSCAYIAYEAVLVFQSAGEPENRKEAAFSG